MLVHQQMKPASHLVEYESSPKIYQDSNLKRIPSGLSPAIGPKRAISSLMMMIMGDDYM